MLTQQCALLKSLANASQPNTNKTMATPLAADRDAQQVERALDCLLTATAHLESTSKLITFAKTVFGDTKVDEGLAQIKEEHATGAYMNGGSGPYYGYLGLMRAFVVFQDMGENGNADELLWLALEQTSDDVLEGCLVRIRNGL